MNYKQDLCEFGRGGVLVDIVRYGQSHIVSTPELNGMIVVEDGSALKYGTKMRSLSFFHDLKSKGYTSVSMGVRDIWISQTAVAWCCHQAGLQCFLFRTNWPKLSPPAEEASRFNVILINVGTKVTRHVSLRDLNNAAVSRANKIPNCYHLDTMLFDEEFIQALSKGIEKVALNHNLTPKAVWIIAHSGVTALSLSRAFPDAMINIVQTTKKGAWPDVIKDIDNLKTWNTVSSPRDWHKPASITPPFRAISYFDAKVWEIASEEGKEGDLIWIVK